MRAVVGKNKAPQQIAEHRYFAWPKAEDNAVLRLARQRLLGFMSWSNKLRRRLSSTESLRQPVAVHLAVRR